MHLWILLMCVSVACNQQIISTSSGKIQGKSLIANGKSLEVYYGIPFAEPPIGQRRFKRPESKKPWEDTFIATEMPNTCPQSVYHRLDPLTPNTNISEDCLYLNIWVPKDGEQSKAVMIWIYGGGYSTGTSTLDLYNGQYLAAENDVIVASMQYRVGAFGFLYLDDLGAPGNMGLLDQNLAMKWIHDNIEAFGGNPNRITIFGFSAGANSVGHHLLSPMSHDLFQYGIMESGSPTMEIIYREPESLKKICLEIVKKMGCTSDDVQDIVSCLQSLEMHVILANQCAGPASNICPLPTNDNYFLTKSPNQYVNSEIKKTSIFTGVNAYEGALFVMLFNPKLNNVTHDVQLTKAEYDQWVKGRSQSSPLAEKALHFAYDVPCNPEVPHQSYKQRASDMTGDSWFVCPVLQIADLYAESEDVYFYEYRHPSSMGNAVWPDWLGASHGAELSFVFGHPLNQSMGYNQQEVALSERMMQYWTNFAKTGTPNTSNSTEWKVYGVNKEYLVIDTEQISMKKYLRQFQCAFWDDLFPALVVKTPGPPPEISHGTRLCGWRVMALIAACVMLRGNFLTYEV